MRLDRDFVKRDGEGDLDWLSPPAFWWPDRLILSAWQEHIPFAFWLIDALRPRRLVEIGVHSGASYCAFCQAIERLQTGTQAFGVDTWEGDEQAGYYGIDVLRDLLEHHDPRYTRFSRLLKSTFDEAVEHFEDGSIDLLHIDGLHTYDAVRRDYETWLPKVSSRGVILLHDINVRERDFGVAKLWSEISRDRAHFAFDHGHGLGVLAAGGEVPEGLAKLFYATDSTHHRELIRAIFARLGASISTRFRADDLEAALRGNAEERARLVAEVEAAVSSRGSLATELDSATEALASERAVFMAEREALLAQRNTFEAQVASIDTRLKNLAAKGKKRKLLDDKLRQQVRKISADVTTIAAMQRRSMSTLYWKIRDSWRPARQALSGRAPGPEAKKKGAKKGGAASTKESPELLAIEGQYLQTASRTAPEVLPLRVLIVAELGLPQCTKYRVRQKEAYFKRLGVECKVLAWHETEKIRSSLQLYSVVIFYRVPGFPDVMNLAKETKRLNIPTFWEVDDLIFDVEEYVSNPNIFSIDAKVRRSILEGAHLYRAMLQACDYGIASTESLAAAMRRAGANQVFLVENALDDETLSVAEDVRKKRPKRSRDRPVRIIYGSGTSTHNVDFEQCAGGLLEVLAQRPQVRLQIVGELHLPPAFDKYADRIERFGFTDYAAYLSILGQADISLAPLAPALFNDAKSNIKFIEAAAVGLPSVCSPRAEFRQAIENGVDGFLATSVGEWTDALLQLVDNADLRAQMGEAALSKVLSLYHPTHIADKRIAPLIERFVSPREKRFRVLVANIYFEPRSLGGATIVAEQIARRLNARQDTDVFVFTSWGDKAAPEYGILRYEASGLPVFAVRLPKMDPRDLEHENPRMEELFGEALDAVRPDVVHLHSVQRLSASLALACRAAGVPYAITLHDAWWLCERQFMVKADDHYCFQKNIDLSVCATCMPDPIYTALRTGWLRRIMQDASLLMSPSEFHRQLYIANGVPPDRIVVNANGVNRPKDPERHRLPGVVRFGYVGGNHPVKGAHLVKRAFADLPHGNYELVLVDNTSILGFSSARAKEWPVKGKLTIIPAYTQETMEDFFGRIDVLLFPSQWKESFGLTVREALVRDIWVIVTDGGGPAEAVIDGENGTVIPLDGDYERLRDAMLDLIRDSGKLEHYRNPHKARIADYDSQAIELRDFLLRASGQTDRGKHDRA